MYEIWINDKGKEIKRQTLSEGQFVLGRSRENEIYVPNASISRQHLRIEAGRDGLLVTDLGSTNGTKLNNLKLIPHQPTIWSQSEELQIGEVTIHFKPTVQKQLEPTSDPVAASRSIARASSSAGLKSANFAIVSAEAEPQFTPVTEQPILIGTDSACTIRLSASNVAPHHCLIQLQNGRVLVTNMDMDRSAMLAGIPLEVGRPTDWQLNDSLQIGSATLNLTQNVGQVSKGSGGLTSSAGGQVSQPRRYPMLILPVAGFALICLAAFAVLAIRSARCGGLNPGCMLNFRGAGTIGEGVTLVKGLATPTLAPVGVNPVQPTSVPTIVFDIGTPTPTSIPIDCTPENNSSSGWLDLPFPYEGTDSIFGGSAENFRRISQRSKFGGRINSFFDHEFPVYPPIFGGQEPDDRDETLVIFNGARSFDAYTQDSDSADWYSGHAGIDFAPGNPREATTPVLAAADGQLLLAKIDQDDNHMVWIEHDPDGDGRFQYATFYLHLHTDDYFFNMMQLEEGTPIAAGQRIGTMGTTGRSSGIHLHFEVRHDANKDGRFSVFERVDPYGWFPSQEIAVDPWSQLVNWIDNQGQDHEHKGIESEYLWIHPLVEVVDSAGECQQVTNVKVDLYNVLGWAVIDPGFTYIARNEKGEILEVGQPHRRTITILDEDLDGVDPSTMSLEWLNPKLDTWFTYKKAEPEPNPRGGYTFSAIVDKTGRYVLVAKEIVDRVPPETAIDLTGQKIEDGVNVFRDRVQVTLSPKDRGLLQSAIQAVQYSLDCGQTWNLYEEAFEVTLDTPHTCGQVGVVSETIELDQNDFLLLAMSEDSEKNIEQPPAQIRFRIE